ncbi:hypothetical protein CP985_00400 [Malaciobacter mytili LMG 24559]|uniref:TniQ domain-containing protein n=1 Tax=Malaciobacter mytili LMG 24559 TaxID=1032238 RepID=A0AAX2AL01_9BACT|nr:TniQ family protein [Malaciobacter mytili]AXH16203.1 transposition-related protein TniQ [Malaciobacter mytili LMG 24559]RXK17104.1 hypothetical protein CP985_00400 [Malaciobacter mytili LMG 24559]
MATQKRNRDWVQDYFFLFIPKVQDKELLSSWFIRMAIEHQRNLSTFISLFIRHEGCATSRTDLDFLYDEKLINQISFKSGLSLKQILQMSLRSEEGYLFTCEENSLYPTFQIRKLVDKRTHNGLMYCPKCLAEDNIPYFRKKWRYSFYNACPKHKIFLTDRCWKCYEKINLSKIRHFKELCFCFKCERDLRETISLPIPSNFLYGLKAIDWFENGLNKGYFFINKKKINSVFVFDSFTKLRYLLNRKEKLNLNEFPMIEEYKDICIKLNEYNSKKALSIKKEFILTLMVYFLFQNYPKNFVNFAYQNNLTHREFVHGFNNFSFWYKNMIDELIPMKNKTGRVISESEVIGAIKYLQEKGEIVNQLNVAEVIGCHSMIHKEYNKMYKVIKNIKE